MNPQPAFNFESLSFIPSFETEHPMDFYSFTLYYTTAPSPNSSIESGMNNTIIAPSSIFTNSYFYQHEIEDGNGATNWPNLTFYGDNESSDSTTAHISGIITGNLTGDKVLELLTELSKNTTGIVTYNYSLEDPTQLNLPPDALKPLPFSGYGYLINTYVKLSNSPTGQLPQSRSIGGNTPDSWLGDLAKGAVNLGISVGTAVWDKAVDLGTELAHIVCSAITAVAVKFTEFVVQLGKAIIDFGKKVIGAFEKAMAEVKAAVEKVVDVIASFIDWVVVRVKAALNSVLLPIEDAIAGFGDWLSDQLSILEDLFNGEDRDFRLLNSLLETPLFTLCLALPMAIMGVYALVTAASMGIGMMLMEMVGGLIIGMITDAFIGDMSSSQIGHSTTGGIFDSFSSILMAPLGDINIDTLDIISMGSAIVGLLTTMFITSQVNLVLSGRIFQAESQIKEVDEAIESVVNAIRVAAVGTTTYTELMRLFTNLITQKVALERVIAEANKQVSENTATGILGVVFGALSIILLNPSLFGLELNPVARSILFGLSIGIGIGGLITSAYSLITGGGVPGIRLLSMVGLGASAIGIGASVYSAFFEEE